VRSTTLGAPLAAIFLLVFWLSLLWVLVAGLEWAINWHGAATPFLAYVSMDSKWAWARAYGADPNDVHIAEPQPSDCDFLHAPLGSKGCHYERRVSLMLRDQRTGALMEPSPLDRIPGSRRLGPDGSVLPIVLEVDVTWLRLQEK
jgi:hypothetical protein